jgi:hypothetical protein
MYCRRSFPEDIFYFQAADMVTQILNFSIPSQINVRTVGYNRTNNLRIAKEMQQKIAAIPGVADVHLQQEINGPELFAQIDRARATQFGLTVNDIALNLNTSLSSSEQVAPNFWTDPANGTPYYLAVQTPEYRDRDVRWRHPEIPPTLKRRDEKQLRNVRNRDRGYGYQQLQPVVASSPSPSIDKVMRSFQIAQRCLAMTNSMRSACTD